MSKTIINVAGSTGVNVNTGHVGGDQRAVGTPPRALEILTQMRSALQADVSLDLIRKEAGLRSLDDMAQQLAAPAPSAMAVQNSISHLGSFASIGSFVIELSKVLGPWLQGLG